MEEDTKEVMTEGLEEKPGAHRRVFSRIGAAYGLMMTVTVAAQLLLSYVGYYLGASESLETVWITILTLVPTYAAGLPVCIWVLKRLPASRPESQSWGLGRLASVFSICVFVMYAGNILGNLLMTAFSVLSGTEFQNPVEAVVMNNSMWMNIIAMVVIAPIGEEFLYRRLLIDRAARYGEGTAVLLSGLVFGLCHGNFFQFFYAFGLGLVFAYVYVKTGKLRYTIAFHMLINFMGSVASVYALEKSGLMLTLYGTFLLLMVILGFLSLLRFQKRITFCGGEIALEKGKRGRIMFLNLGMLFFFAVCIALFLL